MTEITFKSKSVKKALLRAFAHMDWLPKGYKRLESMTCKRTPGGSWRVKLLLNPIDKE